MKIDISRKNKAEILVALYNASRPLGMGIYDYTPIPMTIEEARGYLKKDTYFHFIKGRILNVDLSGDELDTQKYDRDNGEGAAEKALSIVEDY